MSRLDLGLLKLLKLWFMKKTIFCLQKWSKTLQAEIGTCSNQMTGHLLMISSECQVLSLPTKCYGWNLRVNRLWIKTAWTQITTFMTTLAYTTMRIIPMNGGHARLWNVNWKLTQIRRPFAKIPSNSVIGLSSITAEIRVHTCGLRETMLRSFSQ